MTKINNATLTVIIAAKNEGYQISARVKSIAFADEMFVLYFGRTDDTAAQARKAGASYTPRTGRVTDRSNKGE